MTLVLTCMTSGAFLRGVSFAEFASYNMFIPKFISNYEGDLCYSLSRTTVNHEAARLQSTVLEITQPPSEYTRGYGYIILAKHEIKATEKRRIEF